MLGRLPTGRCVALTALLACIVPAAARAQVEGASAAEMTAARETFRGGVTAARASDWETARQAFERSYAILPRPRTLLNLAGAQASTRHLVEATESYRRYLREAPDAGEGDARIEAARAALSEIERRLPRARISVVGLLPDDVLRLDEAALQRAVLDTPYPVDPGAHRLAALREATEVAGVDFRATEGLQVPVHLELPPPAPQPLARPLGPASERPALLLTTTAATEPARSTSENPFLQWWFWTIVGVVAVSGIVTTGVVVAGANAQQPYGGNVPPHVQAIR